MILDNMSIDFRRVSIRSIRVFFFWKFFGEPSWDSGQISSSIIGDSSFHDIFIIVRNGIRAGFLRHDGEHKGSGKGGLSGSFGVFGSGWCLASLSSFSHGGSGVDGLLNSCGRVDAFLESWADHFRSEISIFDRVRVFVILRGDEIIIFVDQKSLTCGGSLSIRSYIWLSIVAFFKSGYNVRSEVSVFYGMGIFVVLGGDIIVIFMNQNSLCWSGSFSVFGCIISFLKTTIGIRVIGGDAFTGVDLLFNGRGFSDFNVIIVSVFWVTLSGGLLFASSGLLTEIQTRAFKNNYEC